MKYLKKCQIFIITTESTMMQAETEHQIFDTKRNSEDLYQMFSFELSDWQKMALGAINKGEHCLVTAPTGSGKTLPAEYAIRHFTKMNKKVIYTSPLKALSNQKYNDFQQEFSDVSFGILTGDIKDNETADVLIMTTEILCNYLHNYKKTTDERKILDFNIDVEHDLGCVIFDEVHYINDLDRGTVWEESIILMPNTVQMVMLSATIDEPERFAQWVDKTNIAKKTVICSTTDRAVPLTHYLWYGTSEEMISKKLENKGFISLIENRTNKLNILSNKETPFNDRVYHDIYKIKDDLEYDKIMLKRSYLLTQLVRFLDTENMLPGICFVYSRKLVETFAKDLSITLLEKDQMQKVAAECRHIITKFDNGDEYMNLPEYAMVVKLLEKGIGVHHAGLIPVLREMVEIMFSKGYVKMLFATETFAVGLNMPTKTVVFTNLRKYSGSGERYLYSHEYTQQAGRAGRRGYDTVGHVIHLANLFELPAMSDYKTILSNTPQTIYSKFKISYGLLLSQGVQDTDYTSETSLKDNIIEFVKKSIVQSDISKEIRGVEYELQEVNSKIQNSENSDMVIALTRDDYNKTKELEYCLSNNMYKKKQKRTKVLELEDLKSKSKQFEREYKHYANMDNWYKMQGKLQEDKQNCENYIANNVDLIESALDYHGFVSGPRKLIASQLKETQCLVMTDLLVEYEMFKSYDERTIIGVLSCFTNINVANDMRVSVPTSVNEDVQELIGYINNKMETYADYELKNGFSTGSDYNINFNVCDCIMEWCDIEDVNQSIVFLKTIKAEKGIFVGEFVKGVLKIVNILKEHEKIFTELVQDLDYVTKIKDCYGLLLKFVCTSQSLYV